MTIRHFVQIEMTEKKTKTVYRFFGSGKWEKRVGGKWQVINAIYVPGDALKIAAAQCQPSQEWDAPSNRAYEPVERRAAEIYAAFDYDGPGQKPDWIPGGNSLKQDLARMDARNELRSAGHAP